MGRCPHLPNLGAIHARSVVKITQAGEDTCPYVSLVEPYLSLRLKKSASASYAFIQLRHSKKS
jgi:hypothetical protein